MIFLFQLTLPHYEKFVESVKVMIYWIKGISPARKLKELCDVDYISYKEEVTRQLGLKTEYNTDQGGMFHSYEFYQLGQTLFLYDKLSYNLV